MSKLYKSKVSHSVNTSTVITLLCDPKQNIQDLSPLPYPVDKEVFGQITSQAPSAQTSSESPHLFVPASITFPVRPHLPVLICPTYIGALA